MPAALPLLAAPDARRLLLHGQTLFGDPARRPTAALLEREIARLGFLQLDSINVVARAHDLTLASRLDGYRPNGLRPLIERRRSLFEHWTHDASAIPTAWFVPWRRHARRSAARMERSPWFRRRLGTDGPARLAAVLARIRADGPLMSKDFLRESSASVGPWWNWKPDKAALDYLWRRGDLAIAGRVHFHKVYDLTERVHPALHDAPPPPEAEYVAWACREAFDRLTVATPAQVRGFHGAVSLAEARAYCATGHAAGRLVRVRVQTLDGRPPHAAFAVADWKRRLHRAEAARGRAPDRMRLLSPFDPALRDRARTAARFGFSYRFEAFTPAARRRYGYYVLPVLRGEDLVARCDAKLHRDRRELAIQGLWWEPGRGRSKVEKRLFEEAAIRLATFTGAESLVLPG